MQQPPVGYSSVPTTDKSVGSAAASSTVSSITGIDQNLTTGTPVAIPGAATAQKPTSSAPMSPSGLSQATALDAQDQTPPHANPLQPSPMHELTTTQTDSTTNPVNTLAEAPDTATTAQKTTAAAASTPVLNQSGSGTQTNRGTQLTARERQAQLLAERKAKQESEKQRKIEENKPQAEKNRKTAQEAFEKASLRLKAKQAECQRALDATRENKDGQAKAEADMAIVNNQMEIAEKKLTWQLKSADAMVGSAKPSDIEEARKALEAAKEALVVKRIEAMRAGKPPLVNILFVFDFSSGYLKSPPLQDTIVVYIAGHTDPKDLGSPNPDKKIRVTFPEKANEKAKDV